ncbi:hypothetical protein [Actinokineospora bangkokensis]|uniref:Integral membrane protein n=1 Tax=Actinokineospora bangkokensis TaxID=1193682 RepID=A0A1Q9LCW2_9PSEU|nr:hypothetical protein [Actinokineospora bangkokensis]OLR89871.1 hypothetical protein BJP25_02335 [Actinokineospora bangkokensis]
MTAPARRSRAFTAGLVLFAVGLLAVVAIFVLAALGGQAPWLWAVSMLLPLGLVVAVVDTVRRR